MEENYLALLLAIFKNVTVEESIKYIKYGIVSQKFLEHVKEDRMSSQIYEYKEKYSTNKHDVAVRKAEKEKEYERQYNEIIELRKQNKTWREIGKIITLTPSGVIGRVQRYEKRKAIAEAPTTVTNAISLNKDSVTL